MTLWYRQGVSFGLLALAAFTAATAPAPAQGIDAVTVYIRCAAEGGKPVSQGSGVLVSADGLVLTAKHVVPDGYLCEGSVGSSRAPRREMDRTPRSTHLDALLLRFTPSPGEVFTYVGFCPLAAEFKEQPVKAAGFFPDASDQGRPSPQPSPRTGIISSVFPDAKGWIQTTVPTTQGMSGGPVLLEGGGALVGIVAGASFDPATGQPQFYGVLAAQEIATGLRLQQQECDNPDPVKSEPTDPVKLIDIITADRRRLSVSGDIRSKIDASTDQIAQIFRVEPEALVEFLRDLGEQDVPAGQMLVKLSDFSKHFNNVSQRLQSHPGDERQEAHLKEQALEALKRGEFSATGALLAELAAVQSAASDQRARDAATTRAQQGEIALSRLRYREAAAYFADAAMRVPSSYESERLAYVERQADALYLQADEGGDETALAEVSILYRGLSDRWPSDLAPGKWIETRSKLGHALQLRGYRERSLPRSIEAVGIFRGILKALSPGRDPVSWVMTQVELAGALQWVGWLETGTTGLEEAVKVARQAGIDLASLRETEDIQHEWSRLNWQTQHNLAKALEPLGRRSCSLGDKDSGTKYLNEAITAYNVAAANPQISKLQRAMSQSDMGRALLALGEECVSPEQSSKVSLDHFQAGISVYQKASAELGRELAPWQWSELQDRLGQAKITLGLALINGGEIQDGIKQLRAAGQTFEEALEIRTRERWPLDWAASQFNRGRAYYRIYTLVGDETSLASAESALRLAVEERTRDRVPDEWAATQELLGEVLHDAGVRDHNPQLLKEALERLRLVQQFYEARDAPRAQQIAHSVASLEAEIARY